ncbi:MAG: PTS sugar transporter subunit IIA [Verrucomicrobia bacterium]|nr:PTS sugar transporter subunit IIA [Verrucomicrobiota bacterium]
MTHREMTPGEASAYLHVSREDLDLLVRREEIPFERKGDRVVFRRSDIDAWASQRLLGSSRETLQRFHRKSSAKAHDLSKQHAIIAELTRADFIEPALACRTRSSVLREMVKLAERTGLLYDPADLLKSIDARERLCSTALQGGIALLHPRSPSAYFSEDSFVLLGRTIQSIPFGAPDGSTSDLFFLVCCQDESLHLHVLARLCMMGRDTDLIMALREADGARSMYEILVRSEAEIVRGL